MLRRPPRSTLFPFTPLFRPIMAEPMSSTAYAIEAALGELNSDLRLILPTLGLVVLVIGVIVANYSQLVSRFPQGGDRKSTRLNSSHANISYAVFCLKKKNKI